MHVAHTLLRYYPFWALPLAFVMVEVALSFRRKKKTSQHYFWVIAGILVISSIAWLAFRGDKKSDRWVENATLGTR